MDDSWCSPVSVDEYHGDMLSDFQKPSPFPEQLLYLYYCILGSWHLGIWKESLRSSPILTFYRWEIPMACSEPRSSQQQKQGLMPQSCALPIGHPGFWALWFSHIAEVLERAPGHWMWIFSYTSPHSFPSRPQINEVLKIRTEFRFVTVFLYFFLVYALVYNLLLSKVVR